MSAPSVVLLNSRLPQEKFLLRLHLYRKEAYAYWRLQRLVNVWLVFHCLFLTGWGKEVFSSLQRTDQGLHFAVAKSKDPHDKHDKQPGAQTEHFKLRLRDCGTVSQMTLEMLRQWTFLSP